MNPIYEHDCVLCKFLGNFTMPNSTTTYDLYFHPAEDKFGHFVLARYGDSRSAHLIIRCSEISLIHTHLSLIGALKLAEERGLLKEAAGHDTPLYPNPTQLPEGWEVIFLGWFYRDSDLYFLTRQGETPRVYVVSGRRVEDVMWDEIDQVDEEAEEAFQEARYRVIGRKLWTPDNQISDTPRQITSRLIRAKEDMQELISTFEAGKAYLSETYANDEKEDIALFLPVGFLGGFTYSDQVGIGHYILTDYCGSHTLKIKRVNGGLKFSTDSDLPLKDHRILIFDSSKTQIDNLIEALEAARAWQRNVTIKVREV